MRTKGYYRFPTIHDDNVVFICEDDAWTVPAGGGVARRLTSNLGQVSFPVLSPDGLSLAFTGREEGPPEVYVMTAAGGPARRLTYLGANTRTVAWTPDGQEVVFASDWALPFRQQTHLHTVPSAGGETRRLPTGPAISISFGPNGGRVIGRNTADLALWKRYRGGTAGDLWIDVQGDGQWRRLCGAPGKNGSQGLELSGNVALPLWLGDRIYFVADHEGVGNVYSCSPAGEDLRRHTNHADYYVRNASSDGRRIIYQTGADLHIYDPAADAGYPLAIQFYSPRVQRNRKFVDADSYLQGYDVHPQGHSLALISRGQAFSLANWEGPVVQHGDEFTAGSEETDPNNGDLIAARRRLVTWLHDGQRLVVVSDAEGEEVLEVHHASASFDALRQPKPANGAPPLHEQQPQRLSHLDIGRPVRLAASPVSDHVALSNHRKEVIVVDLAAGSAQVVDRSEYERIGGLAWSPDGRWLAYGFANTAQTSIIKLCKVETGETWPVTRPVLRDQEPAFDPEGKHLYFLSSRDFDPVYDSLHFDLNFPMGMRPYLVTLRKDLLSPFRPTPRAPGEKPADAEEEESDDNGPEEEEDNGHDNGNPGSDKAGDQAQKEKKKEKPVEIDLEGITERIVAFPVSDGLYEQIYGIEGKVLFSSRPVEGSLNNRRHPGSAPPARACLEVYDFAEEKSEQLVNGITSFRVSLDGKTLIYRAGSRLRLLKAGEKPNNKADFAPSRESGWIDLDRVKVSVIPGAEWAQMYRNAWRLQRDQFWTEDMSGIDWQAVYRRYWPLVSRVATRAEFSDLMWEMQGELGTSHAYEMGGDYRPEPDYYQGFLGADLSFDEESGGYRVDHIVRGDPWDEDSHSPLSALGVNIEEGDILLAVGGRRLSRSVSPQQLLVNRSGEELLLTVAGKNDAPPRTVAARALHSELDARYREWVETNRRRVHEATDGRVGYVHIPDMGPSGYAEFHRGYLAEVIREGLIVDVRFNRGGHVSQLLLEKLSRRRLGYDVRRWGRPEPYPGESVMGPLVAITNEYAGSDGDIFSHAFKMMELGPLIGKRTWGGVIGVWPREALVDGSLTTQPEFSFWFEDVGWGVENYGTDPDIEVEIAPQDYVAGRDPQLERALVEIMRLLAENPPRLPDFGDRPRLGRPPLPLAGNV